MVAQVVIDIRDEHVENDAAIKRKSIDDLGITAALAILGAHHRHCRQEGDADCVGPIEASR